MTTYNGKGCGDDVTPTEPILITCAALRTLGNQGNVIVGQHYLVTDYNRGTVGAATILTHGVSANEVSHSVAVNTVHDDSAWFGRWDPDTCRIYDLFDNRGNKIRSDTGDEVEAFPWGNAAVTGNTFTDTDFNYTAGTVRDNVGHPTARIDITSGTLQRSEIAGNSRVVLAGGTISNSTVSNASYVETDAVVIADSVVDSDSNIFSNGATGRIDQANLSGTSSIEVRGVGNVNIDNVELSANGRIIATNAASVTVQQTSITDSAYFQITAGNTGTATRSDLSSQALVRVLNGTFTIDRVEASSYGRIDHNSTGTNQVRFTEVTSYGRIFFNNSATGNRIDYSSVSSLAYLRFRGTSANGIIDRTDARSQGYVDIQDSNNVLVRYVEVTSLSYVIIRQASNGFRLQYSSFDSYGRMLVQSSTGQMYGIHAGSLGYYQITNNSGIIRYSSMDSYYYLYSTNNTGTKQGLQGHGRQSYTIPAAQNGLTVTGTGSRNF